MEDFDIDYEFTKAPIIKGSIEIPVSYMMENFEKVSESVSDFIKRNTNDDIRVNMRISEDGNLAVEVLKKVDGDSIEYDVEVQNDSEKILVFVFRLKDSMVLKYKRDDMTYLVNVME